MNLRLQLVLGALTLLSAPLRANSTLSPAPYGAWSEGGERVWEAVELPANFVLDLQSGLVTSRSDGDRSTLAYSRGRLVSASPLRLLPPALESPRILIDRDGGEAVPGSVPVVGQELVFDCFDEAWGYLRVLRVSPESVTLEFLLEPDLRRRDLLREPAALSSKSGPDGVRLNWDSHEGELYRVDRRRLPRGPKDRPGDWTTVAKSGKGEWLDDEIALSHLSEYRVSRIASDGGFGSTALGVAGIEPPEVRAELGPGTEVNLLSAIDDGLRKDIKVEYVRPNAVQIFPGEGVDARILSPEEEESWRLSDGVAQSFQSQRVMVSPGRVLALRLPEGIHCLMRVESVNDQMATISRQVDLRGDRIFPPTPELPKAEWERGRGVVFEFGEARNSPPSGEPRLIVEREETLDAGDWVRCTVGEPNQRTLVDAEVGEKLLVRYRFRQGLDGQQVSLSSEAITVLVGGESEAARAELLNRAIMDLGSKDYDRRGRARAVLLALGEGAWPILKDSLRSSNAELASAARELLMSGYQDAEGESSEIAGSLARLFISIRAEELGTSMPPHPDWMSPSAGARASAALRGLGWRQSTPEQVSLWRKILAEADPEESVRQCASLASLLDAEGLGPDLGPAQRILPGRAPLDDDWALDWNGEESMPSGGFDPWTELVDLQARHELEGAKHLPSEAFGLVRERRTLARYLTAHYEREGDELFLDCALRLITDPISRLRGALDLAHGLRFVDPLSLGGERPLVVRLEAAKTELLVEELALLRSDSGRAIEFVLPEGIYEPLESSRQIVVESANFRLRGEGTVELHAGFTLMKGCHAEFENLSIVPETGIAVNVVASHLVLKECLLKGGTTGLLGTDAVVELQRSSVISPESAGRNASGIRFGGRSLFLASESRVESAGVAIYGARATLLDRCVVISRYRNGVEGGQGSDFWLVNSMVHANKAPFSRISQGVLDGAILFGDMAAGLSMNNGLRVCSEHLRCAGELADFDRGVWLDGCTLGR